MSDRDAMTPHPGSRHTAAGLVLLAVVISGGVLGPTAMDHLAPLPAYALRVRVSEPGSLCGEQLEDATARPLSPTSVLEIALRPEEPVSGTVNAQVCVRRAGPGTSMARSEAERRSSASAWALPLERLPDGVFGLRGAVSDLLPDPDRWELIFAIGRTPPPPCEEAAALAPRKAGRWQWRRAPIVVEADRRRRCDVGQGLAERPRATAP